ncbi:MAG: HAMP domain-containing histidine kinase [Williamsia herbipolensis]|nr:HAMP domain-containing histidine kinase [Williamsia herbipolensis]
MTRVGRARPTLTGRIVATTVVVAVVAVLAVAAVGFRLVRQESVGQTRLVLHTSAQAVAVAPAAQRAAFAERIERRSHGRVDIAFGGDGRTTGLDTAVASGLEARLDSATRVSARERDGLRTLLVEAVPARGGGSVIAVEDVSVLHGDDLLWRFLVALGIGLVVAVGLGIALARLITRPLRRVAGTAARLAAGERGLVRDPGHTAPAEVDDIEHAIGALDDALATSEGRQREFLLSVSHELRTPLTAIRGYADALADGLVGPDEVSRIGNVLGVETARLDAFVRDLLVLARLEADDFPIDRCPVDVATLLVAVTDAWSATAERIGCRVRVTRAAGVVDTDPMRIRQVLDGLVENALRTSPAGGEVRLQADAGPDHVAIRVSDDGPGIPDTARERLFDRGFLRERLRAERPVGTGLGLSIAARLIGRLGGRIDLEPGGPGATFVVSLPRTT